VVRSQLQASLRATGVSRGFRSSSPCCATRPPSVAAYRCGARAHHGSACARPRAVAATEWARCFHACVCAAVSARVVPFAVGRKWRRCIRCWFGAERKALYSSFSLARRAAVSANHCAAKSVFAPQRVKGSLRRAAPALDAVGRLAQGSRKAHRCVQPGCRGLNNRRLAGSFGIERWLRSWVDVSRQDLRPNMSVNTDVRELAFVHQCAGASSITVVRLWQARGRRLPLR
jgi:hypothetical protein